MKYKKKNALRERLRSRNSALEGGSEKYTCQGKEYYLTLPKKGLLSPDIEKMVAKTIELDLVSGLHDASQTKYKRMLHPNWVTTETNQIFTPATPVISFSTVFDLVTELENYCMACGRDLKKNYYFNTYNMLKRWGKNIDVMTLAIAADGDELCCQHVQFPESCSL